MLPFSLRNKKRLAIRHMNRPLFPTTLLIPSYDIEKQVGPRTYQHPLAICGEQYKNEAPHYEISPFSCYQLSQEFCLYKAIHEDRHTDTEGYDSISVSHTESLDSSILKASNQRLSGFWVPQPKQIIKYVNSIIQDICQQFLYQNRACRRTVSQHFCHGNSPDLLKYSF